MEARAETSAGDRPTRTILETASEQPFARLPNQLEESEYCHARLFRSAARLASTFSRSACECIV